MQHVLQKHPPILMTSNHSPSPSPALFPSRVASHASSAAGRLRRLPSPQPRGLPPPRRPSLPAILAALPTTLPAGSPLRPFYLPAAFPVVRARRKVFGFS